MHTRYQIIRDTPVVKCRDLSGPPRVYAPVRERLDGFVLRGNLAVPSLSFSSFLFFLFFNFFRLFTRVRERVGGNGRDKWMELYEKLRDDCQWGNFKNVCIVLL